MSSQNLQQLKNAQQSHNLYSGTDEKWEYKNPFWQDYFLIDFCIHIITMKIIAMCSKRNGKCKAHEMSIMLQRALRNFHA